MTNYSGDYTPRVRISYVVDGVPHKTLIRAKRGELFDATAASTLVEAWRLAMEAIFENNEVQFADNRCQADIVDAEFCQQDEDTFIPISATTTEIIAGSNAGGSETPLSRAALFSFSAKSSLGKPQTLYFWGPRVNIYGGAAGTDWRLGEAEFPSFTGIFDAHFDPSAGGSLAALMAAADGQPIAFFRRYVNYRVGAKAINRARSA